MKTIIIMFLLFNTMYYAQYNYIKLKHYYYDMNLIDSIKNAEEKIGVNTFLVFQGKIKNKYDSKEIIDASFLIWKASRSVFVKMITKEYIYHTLEIKRSEIFNYRFIKNTGATIEEDRLAFVPPLLSDDSEDIVIFDSPKMKFYFELGNVGTYKEDKQKVKYRKEWINIIKNELSSNIKFFKKETIYKRLEIE